MSSDNTQNRYEFICLIIYFEMNAACTWKNELVSTSNDLVKFDLGLNLLLILGALFFCKIK